ncbi:MAG: PQQ-binding-like beta-propeller repeat protein [Planctomycetes bacterium]|nr:PQQ-binding-like beta-propeller repeat protein [Planctomycetota bacterium]
MRKLLMFPVVPNDLLQKASLSTDAEVRWRARRVLSQRGTKSSTLLYAVFRAVETGKIKGIVRELFFAIPSCRKEYLRHAAARAVLATARAEDVDFLKDSLTNNNPEVQAIAIKGLARVLGRRALPLLLKRPPEGQASPRAAVATARVLADFGDRRCFPRLVNLLSCDEFNVRSEAAITLRELTGKQFGFAAYDPLPKRNAVIQKWRAWTAAKGSTAKLHFPLSDQDWGRSVLGGNLLLAFGYKNAVAEYDPTGREIWRYPTRGAWSAEKLPNGNVLIAAYYEGKVIEVNRERKLIWFYTVARCLNAKFLRNGNILIAVASGRKVLEVTRDKTIVWEYGTTGNCRDVHRLPNGNTLVAAGTQVVEVTPGKKIVWAFSDCQPYGLQPLRNGNILIADWNGRIIEVNRDKKIVWEYKCSRPADAFRLRNGNTLITTNSEFVEVTSGKVIVWKKSGCRYGTARR